MTEGCHILISSQVPALSSKQLDSVFERKNDLEMISTMQAIFQQMCNGEDVDAFIIPIIKNVSASQYKPMKRLLHMFWPMVDCYYPNGTLKPHMILVCNSILQDLQYPNEYIVCSALRCVMNFQAKEVVQHLVLAVPPLLTNANEEVRATAAICIRVVNSKFPNLIGIKKLEEQLFLEKNPEVLRQIIVSLACVSNQYLNENLLSAIDQYKYFEEHYQIGMGVVESFDKLSSQLQLMIINKLKLFDNINYQIYYKAGQALIKFCDEQPVQNEELLILAA